MRNNLNEVLLVTFVAVRLLTPVATATFALPLAPAESATPTAAYATAATHATTHAAAPRAQPAATIDSVSAYRARAAHKAFSDAVSLEQQGKLRTAIGAYREVVLQDSTYPEANFRMGRLLAGLDRLSEAERAYRSELRFHEGHAAAQRELGLVMVRQSDRKGLVELETLTQRHPEDDQAWQALGYAYSIAGRQPEAERALRRAISYPPERASEHRDLGVVLATLGREADARAEYRAALAIDDDDPATWVNLGNLEARAARWNEALAAYRTAEARDSSYALALQGQVTVLDATDQFEAAAQTARRWLRRRPDDHKARLEAAGRLQRIGHTADALAVARAGVARAPGSGDARIVLSSIYDAQGKTREALRELRAATRLFRDPINRGQAINLLRGTMAAAPESIRVVARQDSVAEEQRNAERQRERGK